MTQHIEIWTQEDCPLCDEAKQEIGSRAHIEYKGEALIKGTHKDIEALTQLAMQGMALPVIRVDGLFVEPKNLKEHLV